MKDWIRELGRLLYAISIALVAVMITASLLMSIIMVIKILGELL